MTHKLIYKILILLTLFTSSCHSKSGERKNQKNNEYISGKVVRILDGDTYDLLIDGSQTIRIRMEGIDAPEKGMPFYKVSKNYLGKLCFGKQVKFKSSGKDIHDRNLGFTYLDDGTELCHEMIRAGLAWHYKKYNSDEDLSSLEIEARNAKIGIWENDNPMPPWENRKLHRQGISTKDCFNSTNKE
jgi:endonuclease YncB( thermonuclease family)